MTKPLSSLRYLSAVLGLLVLLSSAGLSQEAEKLLSPGVGAGPFDLGVPFAKVKSRLGEPSQTTPSSTAQGTNFALYAKYRLAFLVNPEGKLIGITVARKDWKTAEGLGVGSTLSAFRTHFGRGLKRGSGQLAFPEAGLALTHAQGRVRTVYIVKREERDDAKGDRLIIAGDRVGKMRLGRSQSEVEEFLGPPSLRKGRKGQIWFYKDRGIRLGFIQERLSLVGVKSGDWVTPSGIKVGRSFAALKKELGDDYRLEMGSVFYDQWGIGARLEGDTIVELLVFNPKKSNTRG